MNKSRITVLLADDHTIVRQGFRALLKLEPDIEVIGEAKNGREAVELAGQLSPSVVVMDISMPVLNGLEAARQIRNTVPGVRIIMLSIHTEDVYIEQVITLDLAGYLIKHTSASVLSRAIREVYRGNNFFSPFVSKRIREISLNPCSADGNLFTKTGSSLSSREVEVLQLIAEGKFNKNIATILKISIKTVEKHRQSLMKKLDIHDIAGLTRFAIKTGIIESNSEA